MRYSFTCMLFFLFVLSVAAQENKLAMDEKFGFREVKLETKLSKFTGLQLTLKEDKLRHFRKKNENLKLGEYKLKDITYVFDDSTLCGIIIRTEGATNSDGLLQILQEKYDHGSQPNEFMEEYLWESDKVMIKYMKNSVTGDAAMLMQTRASVEKLEKAKQDNNSKAAQSAF